MAVTRAVLVLMVGILLFSSALAQNKKDEKKTEEKKDPKKSLVEDCTKAFVNLGGADGIRKRLSSCGGSISSAMVSACCNQAKGVLQSGPDGCICNAEVWGMVEKQITDAKIPNVNANTLKVFMTYCKIPNYGSRTC